MGPDTYKKPNIIYVRNIDGDYFPKCIKQFVFVIEKQCVICEVEIELLNVIQINFRNQSVIEALKTNWSELNLGVI